MTAILTICLCNVKPRGRLAASHPGCIMNERPRHVPGLLLARLKAAWHGGRTRAGERRDPQDTVAMARDCRPRDFGLTRDDAHRVGEQRRLYRLAEWTGLRGRGL